MRIDIDEWALRLAEATAARSTCLRRSVGCVLLDRDGIVLATGYNGVARGMPHCNEVIKKPVYHDDPRVITRFSNHAPVTFEFGNTIVGAFRADWFIQPGNKQCVALEDTTPHACAGASAKSGESLHSCEAIHAEQNAMLSCRDVKAISACYTTVSPCVHCAKMLMNTGCGLLVYREQYADTAGLDLWVKSGRKCRLLERKDS